MKAAKAEKKKRFQFSEEYLKELLSGDLYRIDSPGDHLAMILEELPFMIAAKYRARQDKHGGRLYRRRVLEDIEGEIIDLIIYWETLEYQIELARAILDDGIAGTIDPKKACEMASNVLWVGNPEGVREPYNDDEEEEDDDDE